MTRRHPADLDAETITAPHRHLPPRRTTNDNGRQLRVLVVGQLPDEVTATAAGLTNEIRTTAGLDGIDQHDWDAVITDTDLNELQPGLDRHLDVLAFASGGRPRDLDRVTRPTVTTIPPWDTVGIAHGRRCYEFQTPDSGDGELDELLCQHLLPAVQRRPDYWFLIGQQVPGWQPLLIDGHGHTLAARYRRSHTSTAGTATIIPADTEQPQRWVRWAIRAWHANRTRTTDDDGSRPMTVAERTATRLLDEHDHRTRQVRDSLAAARIELVAALDAAQRAAQHTPR